MTEEVTVRRDDLEWALGEVNSFYRGQTLGEKCARLNAALAPPQPTLRDALVAAYCGRGLGDKCPNYAAHLYIVDRILPVVEAAVSAAADEAWNAAVTKALWIVGARQGASQAEMYGAVAALRRPTEGSAP